MPNNAFLSTCDTVGNLATFAVQVVKDVPVSIGLYLSEVVRQAAILVRSSALIIWFMMFVMGAESGLFAHYMLEQIGAADYVGVVTAIGNLKIDTVPMFGWILAAKVGCGYVAELGSMRISEEIDALEVMGVHSRAYLAGTRLCAIWITGPFLFLAGEGLQYIGSYLSVQTMLDTTSDGGYWQVFWAFQTPLDLFYATVWAMVIASLIVITGCYYGYTASGGPVGVGRNTAKSMVVNMITISAVAAILYQVFFGTNIQIPIAN